jgi:hypothetical protein
VRDSNVLPVGSSVFRFFVDAPRVFSIYVKSFGGRSLARGTRRGLVAGHIRVVRWSLVLLRDAFDYENVLF